MLPKVLDDIDLFRYVVGHAGGADDRGGRRLRWRGKSHARAMAIPVVGSIALAVLSFG